jgi:hypothetical protein
LSVAFGVQKGCGISAVAAVFRGAMDALALPLESSPAGIEVRWFDAFGCVVDRGGVCEVIVGGRLLGTYETDDADRGPRNLLLIALAKSGVHFGHLAAAFSLSSEQLRRLRRSEERSGLRAVVSAQIGAPTKITPQKRAWLHAQFAAGMNVAQATASQPRGHRLSRSTIRREHERYKAQRPAVEVAATPPSEPQLALPIVTAEPAVEAAARSESAPIERLVSRAVAGGQHIQHAGTWLLMALCARAGLHDAAASVDATGGDGLRIALDAVVASLAIGERCVEGVRRLATPTAPTLLRADRTPSASGVRRRLHRLAAEGGGQRLHEAIVGRTLAAARAEAVELAAFFVDNHLRPYTGQQVVRRGWRMQDKRVRPGATDYYVHDEDGRPVLRVDVPSHDSLSQWLAPIAERLRAGLGEEQRILLAFDRAGSYAEELAVLRDAGFEWVTYERKGYPTLQASAFRQVEIGGELVQLHENRLRNLGKGRGRVRRIAVRVGERQINFLAASREPAERLVAILWDRWVQENAFKHGVERWGINQLDGRAVEPYPPGTIIPNPQRRRIDRALRLARVEEGDARNRLAALAAGDDKRAKIEARLRDAVAHRVELELFRPFIPPRIAVEDSELADRLVRHTGDLKAVVDTVRIVCANAEADLAAAVAPHLPRPAEAKKLIANLLAAPARILVRADAIDLKLAPAANRGERQALAALLADVTTWKLTLPGDHRSRPLRCLLHI